MVRTSALNIGEYRPGPYVRTVMLASRLTPYVPMCTRVPSGIPEPEIASISLVRSSSSK
jgi:hypothetical protein